MCVSRPFFAQAKKAKQAEIDRKRAEVRKRMEEASKAKKAKKGFMTPDRKKKLRVSTVVLLSLSTASTACAKYSKSVPTVPTIFFFLSSPRRQPLSVDRRFFVITVAPLFSIASKSSNDFRAPLLVNFDFSFPIFHFPIDVNTTTNIIGTVYGRGKLANAFVERGIN